MKIGFVLVCMLCSGASLQQKRRNIVFIIADDLGWYDVSMRGSDQIPTPNIDILAMTGKVLNQYRSHAICTPSRSAFLTGKYSHRLGTQGMPLSNSEDRGLPVKEKILPKYLNEIGYATHLVGKWHVGESRKEFLPFNRGFDSHFGHRGGFIDYYEYTLDETWPNGTVTGFGLFDDEKAAWGVDGYITDIYTKKAISVIEKHDVRSPLFLMVAHNAPHASNAPAVLQAPPNEVRAMRHVELTSRRLFAAMVKKLDDSVGAIVEALQNKGILKDTVVVFVSDNGGMTIGDKMNTASNWPLRGLKTTPFEGGVRVPALMWTQNFINTNHIWNGYMHISDWLPTFLGIAGGDVPKNISGYNLWERINSDQDSERTNFFEIDDLTGFASIISYNYKLITGTVVEEYSKYLGGELRGNIGAVPSYRRAIERSKMYRVLERLGKRINDSDITIRNELSVNCNETVDAVYCLPSNNTVCLYNIREDPCEKNDLSAKQPELVESLLRQLMEELKNVIPRKPFVRDYRSRPSLLNYTWDVFAEDSM